MKTLTSILILLMSFGSFTQKVKPDISKLNNSKFWKVYNRTAISVKKEGVAVLNFDEREGDGLAVYEKLEFENGTIEFDVKGRNIPGRSFVGIAFHIQDEETFNAIYFRPFNFENPDKVRSGHSVQYISHPEFTWRKLRSDFPEQFENPVNPVPNPTDWFHTKVIVNWPNVKVFVNNANEPSLDVKIESTFKKGKIGFWAGNGSDGAYKNLVVKNK